MGGDLQAHGRVEQVLQLLGVLRLGTGGGRCGARTSHVAVVWCCDIWKKTEREEKRRFVLRIPRFGPNLCELYFLSRRLVFVLRQNLIPTYQLSTMSDAQQNKHTQIWKRSTKYAIDCKHAVLVVKIIFKKMS